MNERDHFIVQTCSWFCLRGKLKVGRFQQKLDETFEVKFTTRNESVRGIVDSCGYNQ